MGPVIAAVRQSTILTLRLRDQNGIMVSVANDAAVNPVTAVGQIPSPPPVKNQFRETPRYTHLDNRSRDPQRGPFWGALAWKRRPVPRITYPL